MWKIKRATLDDVKFIAENNILMALETEGVKLNRKIVEEGVKRVIEDESRGFYLVLRGDNNRILGQLMITYEWSDWRNCNFFWIQSVYVVKSERKKGIFKALFEEAIRISKEKGACGLRLYVDKENFRAKAVYEKLGMKATHYDMYEIEFIK